SAIRVTVQLIRADNGYDLWSKTYDRNVRDIFKVQDEIATAVVSALKAQLLPAQGISNRHHTESTEAYAQYLIGNRFRYQDTPESNRQALAAYQKAITLDPGYAAAYAALSDAEWRIADEVTGDAAGYTRAQAAAEKAIALAPDSPEGYWARGLYRYASAFDWQGAEADLKHALALEPNFAPARSEYAGLLATLGQLPAAIVEMNKALLVDPLSGPSSYRLAHFLLAAGRREEARRVGQRMVEGNIPGAPEVTGYVALLSGDAQRADLEFRMEPLHMVQLYTRASSQFSLGHQSASDRLLAELVRDYATTQAYQIAEAYAWRGEKDKAFEWLQTAYRQHDRGMTEVGFDPLLAKLRDDPRYQSLLRQMKLPG
ncbi:MAG: tetratricopeptide repeat protein, partial [Terriglobales bacterium]